MLIDNQDAEPLIYVIHIRVNVYYSYTIVGRSTKFVSCINGSNIIIKMAICETHLYNKIIEHEF